MNRLRAQMLIDECTGRDIWSVEYCLSKGIPRDWIERMSDCFESGFKSDRQTIYHDAGQGEHVVNQYEGVRDIDLAIKLAEFLGVDTKQAIASAFSPEAQVLALKEAAEE